MYQPGDFYRLPLEVALRTTEGELRQSIFVTEREYHLAFRCRAKPLELEIDPDRKIFRIPSHRPFRPMDLGFYAAFRGHLAWATIMVRSDALRHGKRLVVVPATFMPVAEALRPYLERRSPNPPELITDDPNADRDQRHPVSVEILTPDKVSKEMLDESNIFSSARLRTILSLQITASPQLPLGMMRL